MRLIPAAFGLALLSSSALAAALPPDLAKAVRDYDQAQINSDRAALERLLADDYTLANSAGHLETKAEFVAESTAAGFRLDPFVVEQPVEKVWAGGAVMGGVVRLTGLDGGKPFTATLRFSDVWAKRNGAWRVIYTQANRMPG